MEENKLSDLLPPVDKPRYNEIKILIEEMLSTGTVNQAIIANAAKRKLKAVKLLQDYQRSDEWKMFGWGSSLVKLDGKMFFIGKLRTNEEDFDEYPFEAYEVVGVKKLKFKRKVDVSNPWERDVLITWAGLKSMQLIKRVYISTPLSHATAQLNKR